MTFRLLLDPALDGAANMARDRALLDVMQERLARGDSPAPILRLYSWSPATVSTGRHQVLEAACHLEACLAEGVDVVQRPTGGRAVLHDDEVTYALIAPAAGAFEGAGVERGAALISRALARGLASMGAAVESVKGVAPASPRGVREACFVSASRSELVFEGRKVVGSAQLKGRAAILQHGSLPLHFDVERQSRLLGTPADLLRRHAAGLDEALGARPSPADVQSALARGLAEELAVEIRDSTLDDAELARQGQLEVTLRAEPRRFRSAAIVRA